VIVLSPDVNVSAPKKLNKTMLVPRQRVIINVFIIHAITKESPSQKEIRCPVFSREYRPVSIQPDAPQNTAAPDFSIDR
jgi:hypothetical protein